MMSEIQETTTNSNDPLARVFGDEFARIYNSRLQEIRAKALRLTDEEKKKIKQYIQENKEQLLNNNAYMPYDKYDLVLVVTPSTENALKRTVFQSGATAVNATTIASQSGWISLVFNDANLTNDLELNTAYIAVGKLSERVMDDGSTRLRMTVYDLIKL
jgi:flavoprotein